jgi:hypothetical protein
VDEQEKRFALALQRVDQLFSLLRQPTGRDVSMASRLVLDEVIEPLIESEIAANQVMRNRGARRIAGSAKSLSQSRCRFGQTSLEVEHRMRSWVEPSEHGRHGRLGPRRRRVGSLEANRAGGQSV